MKLTIEEIRQRLASGTKIAELPLNVTAYIRVSTDHEEQKSSVVNQTQYFENKILANSNWTLIPFYIDDAKSGTSVEHRQDFLRMIQDGKTGVFDLILTKEVSRFARDTLDSIKYTRQLSKYDVGVHFEDIGLNTIEPDAEFRLVIMAGIAQEESRKLSERVKFGWARGSERGVRRGATAPIGYVFNNETNGYSIDESRCEMVRYVFAEYARNELGTRRIANNLKEMGFVNEAGNPYNPSTLERMIQNPVYWGNIVNGKSKKPSYRERKKIAQSPETWQLHYDPIRVPPIVTKEEWDAANAVLSVRGERMKGVDCTAKDENGGGKYAYTSRIFCGDHNMNYHRAISRWDVDGDIRMTTYWRCGEYKKYGKKACNAPLLYTDDLNEMMRIVFKGISPALKDEVENVVAIIESVIAPVNETNNIESLQRQIEVLTAKKTRILDGWINSVITDGDYKEQSEKIEGQILATKERIDDLTHIREKVESIQRAGRIMDQTFKNADLENDEIVEELVRTFVKQIKVRRDKNIENSYVLDVCLYGGLEPIQLSLCNHTLISPRTKGRLTAPLLYTLPPRKQELSYNRDITIEIYIEVA